MHGFLASLVITDIMLQSPSHQVEFIPQLSVKAKICYEFAQLNNYLFEPLGGVIRLDSLVYVPPRNGPTIWEIGFPDRKAAEFYVPEPYPTLMNKLYNEQRRDK